MSGWIKLYRKLTENPLWTCEPFTRGQAWVDLILLTNHADNFFYKRGVKVDVSRGQCAWSELALSVRWRWSRNKVRKFLNDLEKEQQIIQQKNNVTQIVTIVNYNQYQEKRTTDETTEGQQKDTKRTLTRMNKNEKNEKNIYTDFIEKFNQITGKKIRVADKKFKGQLNQRLKDGFSIDEILEAVENCKKDEFHCQNPQYLTPEFITRSDKLQKYLNSKEVIKQKPKLAI